MSRISKTINRALPTWFIERINQTMKPVGIELPIKRGANSVTENTYQAEVTGIKHETPRSVTIQFKLLEGYRLSYKSGQFVTVSVPIGAALFQRCYSFSSAPHDESYAVTVQTVFRGRVSAYIKNHLKVGDTFYIDDPEGDFVLPPHPEEQRYVMIAAGAGIVPIYSLIRDLLGKNANANIQLVYACRNREQAIFLKELERFVKDYSAFSLLMQFTRKAGNGHDPYRRLSGSKILSKVSDPTSARIYVCGPYGLVKKCSEGFEQVGISKSRILIEMFHSPPQSLVSQELKPRPIAFVPASFIAKAVQVRQRQVETVLESASRAGVAIPRKCTVGNCQTCKVKVKSGSVLMDEPNSLSIEDAKNGYILSCVSYPCEPLVVKLPD